MRSEEFLTFADDLAKPPYAAAAAYRTAISRAYYSAFHTVKAFVEQELDSRIRGGGNEHTKLQHSLRNSQVEPAAAIGTFLETLHNSRKLADYELGSETVEMQDHALYAVALARKIRAMLDDIRGDAELLRKVKAGVQAYVAMRNQGS